MILIKFTFYNYGIILSSCSLSRVAVNVVWSLDIDCLLYSASLGALRVNYVLEVAEALVSGTLPLDVDSCVSRWEVLLTRWSYLLRNVALLIGFCLSSFCDVGFIDGSAYELWR